MKSPHARDPPGLVFRRIYDIASIVPVMTGTNSQGRAVPETLAERTVFMRKRNVPVQFFLDNKEAAHLAKLVKRSGLTQSTYLRHLINGVVPQDAPPPDYYRMMEELRGIGVNLNYIAQAANDLGMIDAAKYDEAVQTLNRALLDIIDAVRMPRKRE